MRLLNIVKQHSGIGAATIYQGVLQRTFGRIELAGDHAIENRNGGFHAGCAAEATNRGDTGFAQMRIQSRGQSGDRFHGASSPQSQQCGSLLQSARSSGFVDAHIEQPADAKTIEQRGQLVSRRHLDAIEQNGFNDVAIERIEAPVYGRDFA